MGAHCRRAALTTLHRSARLSLAAVVLLLLVACRAPFTGRAEISTPAPTATALSTGARPAPSVGAAGPLVIAAPGATPSPLPAGTPVVLGQVPPTTTPAPTGDQALTLAGGSDDPPTLDPALVADEESAFLVRQLFRGLVSLRTDLSVVPDLAQTVEISADRKTYTFHLLPGLRFQSGKPLQAQDVKYSLERALDPALVAARGGALPAVAYLGAIAGAPDRIAGRATVLTGVQVVDDTTLRIELSRADQDFLQALALPSASVVRQADVARGADWWRAPDGSGPFALSQWAPGERIVLNGYSGYKPRPPLLKTVTILLGASAAAPTTLYERDMVDAAPVPEGEVARYLSPGLPMHDELHGTEMLAASYVFLNPAVPPFNDARLRRALILAFPRDKIPTVTANGHERPMTSLVPVADPAWRVDLPPYDLPAAKALLAQIGGASDPLTLYTGGDWTPAAMAQVYQRDLGVRSEVVQLQGADFVQRLAAHSLTVFSLSWISDLPDPGSVLTALFASGSPSNPTGYANPQVDRLLGEAAIEPDPTRRVDLYRQAQARIVADDVVVPVSQVISYDLIKPRVHDLARSPLGMLGLESVWVTR